jgi:hypothetical protein
MKENLNVDLSKTLNIKQNLKKSIIVTAGSTTIGAIMFFIAYGVTQNLWLLSLGIILFVSGLAFAVVVKMLEKKYTFGDDDNAGKE